jgi:hypothetical protein
MLLETKPVQKLERHVGTSVTFEHRVPYFLTLPDHHSVQFSESLENPLQVPVVDDVAIRDEPTDNELYFEDGVAFEIPLDSHFLVQMPAKHIIIQQIGDLFTR